MTSSPRIAPGLFTAAAWDLLRAADEVLTDLPDHPQREALLAAGVPVGLVDVGAPVDPRGRAAGLLDRASGRLVVWLADPDAPADDSDSHSEPDADLGTALARLLVEHAEAGAASSVALPEVELLPASYDLPGAHLLDLVEVMDRLRSPGGCPWDAKQTHASLVPYLIEEAYEVVEAVENADGGHLREELGDVLLQVAFHARVAAERSPDDGGFTIDDVADTIVAKLISRHPHVFDPPESPAASDGGDGGDDPAAVVARRWEELKAAEKGRTELDEGIPRQLPALAYAAKLVTRAAHAGRLESEADATSAPTVDAETLGAALLGLVQAAVLSGLDPEAALRAASREFAAGLRRGSLPG